MNDLSLYSNEPLWETSYTSESTIHNGWKVRLDNINRNNNKNVIYVDIEIHGKIYMNIWRGYRKDGVLTYELSNHQLIDGDGRETYFFQDFTELNIKYINYYVEIEALETVSFQPYETGLYFDDILSSRGLSNKVSCGLNNDINSNPLQTQIYTKYFNFNLIVNRGYIQQVVNIIEKPYYIINKISDFIDNSSKRLSNNSISTSYVTNHTKYVEIALTNVEEI